MLLGKALQTRFGETGVLALAAASGIADVDAITLSLASDENLGVHVAVTGIVVAAASNSIAKAAMAAVAGDGKSRFASACLCSLALLSAS